MPGGIITFALPKEAYADMAELADALDSGSNAPKRLFLWLPNPRKPGKIKAFRAFLP